MKLPWLLYVVAREKGNIVRCDSTGETFYRRRILVSKCQKQSAQWCGAQNCGYLKGIALFVHKGEHNYVTGLWSTCTHAAPLSLLFEAHHCSHHNHRWIDNPKSPTPPGRRSCSISFFDMTTSQVPFMPIFPRLLPQTSNTGFSYS